MSAKWIGPWTCTKKNKAPKKRIKNRTDEFDMRTLKPDLRMTVPSISNQVPNKRLNSDSDGSNVSVGLAEGTSGSEMCH